MEIGDESGKGKRAESKTRPRKRNGEVNSVGDVAMMLERRKVEYIS